MNVRLAKKVLSSVAVSAAILSALAACDLGLAPFEPQADAGPITPFDSGGPIVPSVDSGAVDAGSDAADGGGIKRVFVTSQRVAGDFNGKRGQAGADNICQTLASGAKLGGKFVAYVSETTKPAIDHLVDVGPWYLVDRRTLVFPNKLAIASGPPMRKIDRDENGNEPSDPLLVQSRVWTGTLTNGAPAGAAGTAANFMCSDWQVAVQGQNGTAGEWDSNDRVAWVQGRNPSCSDLNRLYCFEQ